MYSTNSASRVGWTGPRSVEQMRQGLAAIEAGPLSEAELTRIRRIGDHVHG